MYRGGRIVVMIVSTDTIDGFDVICGISDNITRETGADICELPPLYETIDPDALDAFLRCSDSTDVHPERSVEFSYCGYRVTVASTGQIEFQRESELTSPIPST